ncbi:hypothetical protein [Azospirillum endophyticum]
MQLRLSGTSLYSANVAIGEQVEYEMSNDWAHREKISGSREKRQSMHNVLSIFLMIQCHKKTAAHLESFFFPFKKLHLKR